MAAIHRRHHQASYLIIFIHSRICQLVPYNIHQFRLLNYHYFLFMLRKRTKHPWIYSISYGYIPFFLICASSSNRFEYSAGHVEAISVRPEQQNQHHFVGIGGATSVHFFAENTSLLVGTKKGGIYYSLVEQKRNQDVKNGDFDPVTGNNRNRPDDADENYTDRWIELKSNEYTTKYPIYSTAVMSGKRINSPSSENGNDDKKFIFCGSGDRWISVWKLGNANNDDIIISNSRNQTLDFEFVQKLGPHTGWVKGLVYDDRNRLLHSIGCNCIETWDCSSVDKGHNDHASSPISHITKRTIENCPTTGSTLSSDLLCLCLLPSIAKGGKKLPRLLVSGGVDGRIHLWLSKPTAERTYETTTDFDRRIPLHTTLAHDGRVNAIVYSSATNAIFTTGNDGLLCVFRASLNQGFELVSRLKIEEGSKENSSRITVASVTRDFDEQGRCSLVLGSSKGELYFVTAEINAEGGIDSHVEGDCMIVAENSMIYTIASEKDSGPTVSPRLWVGHASGLAMVDAYT